MNKIGKYHAHRPPRGAQNVPVDSMLNVLINFISSSAATSGVTAANNDQYLMEIRGILAGLNTSSFIPELVKPHTGRQVRTHETRTSQS